MGEIAAGLPKGRVPAFRLRSLGDDRLSRLAASGDSRAFAVVYARYNTALYRYCRSLLGDPEDASDALQSTMAAALRGLKGETREIKLKPWLFRIAHNECVSVLRTRRPHASIDEALEVVAPEGTDAATRERLRQLMADLRELPDAQRGALVMRELSGLSYDEIAVVLGGSVAAARQTVFEARSTLHDLAEGRAMDCDAVRRALSDADGRVLRGRKLRAHLSDCGSCRDFRALIGNRRRDLACLAPPLPMAAAVGLMHQLLGGGSAAVSTGGSAGGAGLASLAAGKAVIVSTALKATAVVVATAAVGAGTVEVVKDVEHSQRPSPRAAHARPVTPPASAKLKRATGAPGAGARLAGSTPAVVKLGRSHSGPKGASPQGHRHHHSHAPRPGAGHHGSETPAAATHGQAGLHEPRAERHAARAPTAHQHHDPGAKIGPRHSHQKTHGNADRAPSAGPIPAPDQVQRGSGRSDPKQPPSAKRRGPLH